MSVISPLASFIFALATLPSLPNLLNVRISPTSVTSATMSTFPCPACSSAMFMCAMRRESFINVGFF